MSQSVTTIKKGKVLEITLNRPPVNAINLQTSCDLYEAFKLLQEDPELCVGIITSAGWDLKEFSETGNEMVEQGVYDLGPGGLGGMSEFWQLKKPVIAAVNGKAIGGGFEMLLAADIIIAADHVEFILPETHLGFLADGGGIQRLSKRIPYNIASELMLTGRPMSAQEAHKWGLVSEVVPKEDLLDKAREMATSISKAAPLALQAMKEVMQETHNLSDEQSFKRTHEAWRSDNVFPKYKAMLNSEDYLEGSNAFAEKREPNYQGR